MDQVDWIPVASATPVDGYATFNLPFSEIGTYYLKGGDDSIELSVDYDRWCLTDTSGRCSRQWLPAASACPVDYYPMG